MRPHPRKGSLPNVPDILPRPTEATPGATPMPDENRYLIVKGKAGLGNRLMCLLAAMLYAEMSGRRLCVDWTVPGYGNQRTLNLFPHLFAAPANAIEIEALDPVTSVTPSLWCGNLNRSVDELMAPYDRQSLEWDQDPRLIALSSIDQRRLDYRETIAVRWAWLADLDELRPHMNAHYADLAGLSEMEILRTVARLRLDVSPEIKELVDEFRRESFAGVTIGVHVRYSDRKCPYQGYPARIDQILSHYPDASIYLATDNSDVEGFFRERYPRLLTRQKWFSPPGRPLHRGNHEVDMLRREKDALVELCLLSQCDHLLYHSRSSFGAMASILSQAPLSHLVDMMSFREAFTSRLWHLLPPRGRQRILKTLRIS